jgi:transcriptional regulator with XRE-family HTH domain
MPSLESPIKPTLTPARMRLLMKRRGLTGADVARGANIGEAEISRIVSRNMQPTDRQIERLIPVLDPATDGPVGGGDDD